jgi:hypothetical protein
MIGNITAPLHLNNGNALRFKKGFGDFLALQTAPPTKGENRRVLQ